MLTVTPPPPSRALVVTRQHPQVPTTGPQNLVGSDRTLPTRRADVRQLRRRPTRGVHSRWRVLWTAGRTCARAVDDVWTPRPAVLWTGRWRAPISCTGCGPEKVSAVVYDADSATDIRTAVGARRASSGTRTTARSSASPSRPSAPWWPSRSSCSPTRRSSATSAPRSWPASASPVGCWPPPLAVRVPGLRHHRLGGPPGRRRRPARRRRPGRRRHLAGARLGVLLAAAWLLAAEPLVAAFGTVGRRHAVRAHLPARLARSACPRCCSCSPRPACCAGCRTPGPRSSSPHGAVVNVVLNVVLVYGLDLGVAGSALGTVLAQAGMAAAFVAVVVRGARAPARAAATGPAGHPRGRARRRPAAGAHADVARRAAADDVRRDAIGTSPWPPTRSPSRSGLFSRWRSTPSRSPGRRSSAATSAPGTSWARGRPPGGWSSGASRSGVVLGACWSCALGAYVPLFTADPDVRRCSPRCWSWPRSGSRSRVVFVLDGVLIGAGDGRYLAGPGWSRWSRSCPGAGCSAVDAGLVALWWAFGAFMSPGW